jgi:hypothetical protein
MFQLLMALSSGSVAIVAQDAFLLGDHTECWLMFPDFTIQMDDDKDYVLPYGTSTADTPLDYCQPKLRPTDLNSACK